MVVESYGLTILAAIVTAIVVALLIRDPDLHRPRAARSAGPRRRRRAARDVRPRHRRAA